MMQDQYPVIDKFTAAYVEKYPEEVALHLEGRSVKDILSFLQECDDADMVALLQRLSPALGARVLAQMDDRRLNTVIQQGDFNRTAILMSHWDADFLESRIKPLKEDTVRDLRLLLQYPADSAGHYMDPRVLTFRPETTVKEARMRLRKIKKRRVIDFFIVDDAGRLKGSISLQDLLMAEPQHRLQELIAREPPSVQAVSSRDEAIDIFKRGRLSTLPVVDFEGRLLGVIRQQAMMSATEQEASIELQTMVGVSKDERAFSKVPFSIQKRLPWLHINLVTAFLAAAVVGIFEGTIARFTALAVLMPVVAGQSGNTGAQALAVTMRGLVLREVRVRQWPRVLWKEAQVGLINGIAVALTTAVGVWIWSRSPGLAMVIALAMVISMVAAGLAGALIPILLSVFGQDPATSSSIILTTVTDVVGFLSFLGLATVFAGLLQ